MSGHGAGHENLIFGGGYSEKRDEARPCGNARCGNCKRNPRMRRPQRGRVVRLLPEFRHRSMPAPRAKKNRCMPGICPRREGSIPNRVAGDCILTRNCIARDIRRNAVSGGDGVLIFYPPYDRVFLCQFACAIREVTPAIAGRITRLRK